MSILLELSDNLCIEPVDLMRFASTSPYRYKVYSIPKRNGKGNRTIAHPSRELKYVQRTLIEIFQDLLPIHKSAMAYRKGISIRDNAGRHACSRYLLKMDFTNFFPSITPELFFDVLSNEGIVFSDEDKQLLKGLLFWRPVRKGELVLSIGAPTSPIISNSLLYLFDENINDVCEKNNIVYTRYADDLTFSTNVAGMLFEIPSYVQKALDNTLYGKISINKEKTVFSSKAHNRHVTGVTITNEAGLSIGRDKKRKLSAAVHWFINGRLSDEEISSLQGEISFSKYIEPQFYARLEKKYGGDVMNNLLAHKKR